MEKKILYFDMDGVLVDFMSSVYALVPEIDVYPEPKRKKVIKRLCHVPEFYLKMPPISGAIEAWHKLSEKYDNYILSAPKWSNPYSYLEKRQWCEKWLGDSAHKKLILTHNKGAAKGFALIDDRLKYGVDKFEGIHIHYGTEKFPDWESVTAFLLKQD